MSRQSLRSQPPRSGGGRDAAPLSAAFLPVVEHLENRCLFAYPNTIQTLPFTLEFNQDRGGVVDRDGQGTGFTRVQENKNLNEYVASLIDLDTAGGVLRITSSGNASAGGNYNGDNTLTNGLETQFDGTTSGFSITTRLVGPLSYINNPSEQAGIMFGPDQDNYVKLVAESTPDGTFIQFIDEQASGGSYTHSLLIGGDVTSTYTSIGSFASVNTLDLRLVGDAGTGVVSAYYAVNGGAFVKIARELTLSGAEQSAFFAPAARAGLIAMHKNNLGAETFTFERFEINPGTPVGAQPRVTGSRPADGDIGVARNAFVAADVYLPTPGAGVDEATLTPSNVKLYRTSNQTLVPSVINTTGGGDAIVLTPSVRLDANTSYTFEVTSGVKDTSGAAFQPYKITFTTGTSGGEIDDSVAFEKVSLPSATGHKYTVVKMGPDGKLYAGTIDGLIQRFTVNPDGTLGTPQTINTVQAANGGNRLLVGMAFDPASTASNLILWISHSEGVLDNATDWTGKISKLTGANLQTYQDAVINLPRSVRDHVTNQVAFGPDGGLYFNQGAMSAMGAPDNAWALRSEHLLSAATLRLDTSKVGSTPIDAKTESGGTYNPFAPGAPLTIYATGVRNAYDLVWHSNGTLYTAANGSAAGGNTPGGGGVPALNNVSTQPDLLFRIQQGKYYGHPNPTRSEYVLNGGNPTASADPTEVLEYPVGTLPDSDYGGVFYNFGKNYSPDGMIEYRGSAFGGVLDHSLMVVRYSGGDDILILKLDDSGNVIETRSGAVGLTGFVDPLDVEEDLSTGFLYVSEYGADKLTLLRPTAVVSNGANITASKSQMVFNDVYTTSGTSPAQKVKFTNSGTGPLTIDSFTLSGTDAAKWTIGSPPPTPVTLQAGESIELSLTFKAGSARIYDARLVVNSNDTDTPSLSIDLRGLGTAGTGGTNEPSLQRILDLYRLPINVGDSNPSDVFLDAPPVTPNDELDIQRLTRAGNGPVTIEPLAVFGVGSSSVPTLEFGYYKSGNRLDRVKLFTVSGTGSATQTVDPSVSGLLSFDPGSLSFGVYALWPSMSTVSSSFPNGTEGYSEDAFNVAFDPAQPRKFRFYQLKDTAGTVVPNAYLVAAEDFTGEYDTQDIVFIIRNVKPAAAGAEIGIENLDGAPFSDRMVFSKTTTPNPTFPNGYHDTGVLRIRNTGSSTLTISNLSISGPWTLSGSPTTPINIAAGDTYDLTLRFTATSGTVHNGSLTITSNDADEPTTVINLAGWRQANSENPEPTLAAMMPILGYGTVITYSGQSLNEGGLVDRVGDEVLSPYWKRADNYKPVTVRQLAAYHTQGDLATLRYFSKGAGSGTSGTVLFTHENLDAQTFLPRMEGSSSLAAGSWNPSGTFGFRIDAAKVDTPNQILKEWSDDSFNNQEQPGGNYGHHVRFFVARDGNGKIIANTYLMVVDYASINYDYQDNVYLVENVRPDSPPAAPTGAAGSNSAAGVVLNWNDSTEANLAGYNIYRSSAAGGPYTKINTGGLLTSSDFTDTGAPLNATSYYRITAVDNAGNESAPAETSVFRSADSTPPAAPTNLTGTGSTGGISLDWDNNLESDLAGYNVYRSGSLNGTYTKINLGGLVTGSAFLDTNAPSGVTSFYRVTAVDTSGNESEGFAQASVSRPASGTDVTRNPVADATVRSGSYAGQNFGTAGTLTTKTSSSSNNTRESYLRFDLSTLSGVSTVKLRLYGYVADTSHSVDVSLFAVDDITWSEDGITFDNRPASGAALGSRTVDSIGSGQAKYFEWDVTSYVLAQLSAGRSAVSFVLKGGDGRVEFNSDESAANRPELSITTSDGGGTDVTPPAAPTGASGNGTTGGNALDWADNVEPDLAGYNVYRSSALNGSYTKINLSGLVSASSYLDDTAPAGVTSYYRITAVDTSGNESSSFAQTSATRPSSGTTVTLNPVADATVRGGSSSSLNFGSADTLTAKLTSNASNVRNSYLRFDLTGLSDVSSVKLRLFGYVADSSSPSTVTLSAVDDVSWAEGAITFDTAPPIGSALGNKTIDAIGSGQAKYFEWDVTSYVQQQIALGKTQVSFCVGGGNARVEFNSRDAAGNHPELVATATGTPDPDVEAPSAPTGLTATGSTTMVALDWSDNAESDLAGYNVYTSDSADGTYTRINGALVTGSSFSDTGAPVDVMSYYKITAVDTSGNESDFSTVASAMRTSPPVGSGMTLIASDDAMIRSGSYGDTNFGSATTLEVKDSNSASNDRRALLKFDLSGVTSVSSAFVRLYGYLADANKATGITLYALSDAWDQSTVTFNTAPVGTTALASQVVTGYGSSNAAWYELDVTSYLQQALLDGRTQVSFAVRAAAGSNVRVSFASTESGANAPELDITA